MTRFRLTIIQYIIPILLLLIIARLFYWQIWRREEFISKAASQHTQVVSLPAHRGQILASDGSLLAGTQITYLLYAYKPDLEQSPQAISNLLTPILVQEPILASGSAELVSSLEDRLKENSQYLQDRLSFDRSWIALKHFLSASQKEAIEGLDLKGIGFEEEIIRFYPEASMSAHLLGFVGQNLSGQPQGYFGLEGYYDRQLQGRPGLIREQIDLSGNPILIGDLQSFFSHDGFTLQTTINRAYQYQVEKLLTAGIERYGAKAGSVIVMEPKTGAVLSLAALPSYDPRIFYKYPPLTQKNPVVADLFEPGSIFKPLVLAAALDANLVTPETRCDICAGPIQIGSFSIRTWNEKYYPQITMTETLVHSDNTGMVFVARRLGAEKLHRYLANFGLGEATGIDLQEETSGSLRPASDWKEIDFSTIAFGQGIALTRLQMLVAFNALANQGLLVTPFVVKNITDGRQNLPADLSQRSNRRVVSKPTAQTITQMLIAAVDQGEAKWAKPKGVAIAGKTGTAQIPVAGHYDEEKTIASFIGFAPAQNPRFTMLVTLTEPESSPWGSETAAPLWFDIARSLLLLN